MPIEKRGAYYQRSLCFYYIILKKAPRIPRKGEAQEAPESSFLDKTELV